MNIFKKIFIPSGEKVELKAYETWFVRWTTRHGEYFSDTKDTMEVFTSKEDAELFADQLKAAFKLIKYTSGNRVTITKD